MRDLARNSEYIGYQKALHRVRPKTELESRFVRYWLEDLSCRGELARRATGSTIKHLPQVALRDLPLALPPLDEQHRIVAVLEDHLSRLGAAHSYTDAVAVRTKSMLSATLDKLVADGEAHELVEVLAEPLRNGLSSPGSVSGRVRTLTLTAVTAGVFEDRFTKMTAADPRKAAGLYLRPGDILVQRSNTPQLVGTSALYEGPEDWAIFPDLLIRARVDQARVRPAYAAMSLASTSSRSRFRRLAKGLAGSMPKIDQSAIAGAVLRIPALPVQDERVSTFRELRVEAGRLTTSSDGARQRANQLRGVVMASAFAGRL